MDYQGSLLTLATCGNTNQNMDRGMLEKKRVRQIKNYMLD